MSCDLDVDTECLRAAASTLRTEGTMVSRASELVGDAPRADRDGRGSALVRQAQLLAVTRTEQALSACDLLRADWDHQAQKLCAAADLFDDAEHRCAEGF